MLEPSNPPVEGIKCLGSDDMPKIMLGSRPIGLSIKRSDDTKRAMAGG